MSICLLDVHFDSEPIRGRTESGVRRLVKECSRKIRGGLQGDAGRR
jgi:hypothetical protein